MEENTVMATNVDYAVSGEAAAVSGMVLFIYLAIIVLAIIGNWKLFTKAGQPGWACIIPIYNIIVFLQVAKKPLWWCLIIFFVPIANVAFQVLMLHAISQRFDRGVGTTLGLIFFPIIFMLILGFGSAEYQDDEPVTLEV